MNWDRTLLLALAIPFLTHQTTAQQSDPGIIPGDILLMLTPEGRAGEVVRDLCLLDGVETGLHVDHLVSEPMRIWLLKFTPGTVSQDRMLAAVQRHRDVMMAQNDHPVAFRVVPNDPLYSNQWQHPNIQSPQAWDVTTGGTTATGDEIVVCVIERSNLLHTDLVANRWLNTAEIPNNGIDDDGNGYVDDYLGWNPVSNNDQNLYGPNAGHGTNVAGMIGAVGNNGVGVAGANWNVKIMVVDVGNLTQANVIQSYTYPWVMRRRYNQSNGQQGAFVVATNASWGLDGANPNNYPLWCAIYDSLGAEGVLNCGATANNNVNVDVVGDMPTACPSPFMVSVTATNSSNNRTFSAYGPTTIDVGAPGDNIYTTSGSSGYTYTSGTSFASPLTAGVIGLLYSAPCPSLMALVQSDPQAGALYVRQKLFQGVQQVGNLPGTIVTGGRINVNNSMQLIMNECGSVCTAPGGLAVQENSATSATATWNASGGGTFNLRYRPVGGPTWTTVNGLSQGSHTANNLATCTQYEFQVQRDCGSGATSNWSSSITWVYSACCTPVTVTVVSDRYGIDITWSLSGGGTTYASGGPYPEYGANGSYPQPSVNACLPDGCYQLVVNDSWGDGICCAYGNGSIQVIGPGGQVLAATPSGNYSQVTLPFCVSSQVRLNLKAFLEGPYVGPLMSDGLRTGGYIPQQEPYTAMGWPQQGGGGETIGGGVLGVTGNNAIVDWVRVELRQAANPAVVVAARNALIQRDGDVVDAVDGTSSIGFLAPAGNYHVAIRHRNHLGCMTASTVALSATATSVDLTLGGTSTYGGAAARKTIGSIRALWAGDVTGDGVIQYTGPGNDRDPVLSTIGGTVPSNTNTGYNLSDVNLDGMIKYTGIGNDRDPILVNIGGAVPTNTRAALLP